MQQSWLSSIRLKQRTKCLGVRARQYAQAKWRAAIEQTNMRANAMVYVSESTPSRGDLPLQGKAIAIKDNICTISMRTSCASSMLKESTSPFDATVVSLLAKAGADIIGKTNCDEFGMGSSNVYSIHGPVINPFQSHESNKSGRSDKTRSAGGSSGGSAAAVASGMCYAALGTDTGGSIRLPASYCGIVGYKPSYGLISRHGVISFADSLDCVGIMAQGVKPIKDICSIISKYDPKDPTAASPPVLNDLERLITEYFQLGGKSLSGIRIGVPQEYFPSELSPTVIQRTSRVLDILTSLGAIVVPVSLPSTHYALSAYYVISSAEASSNMARYDGVQYGQGIGTAATAGSISDTYSEIRTVGLGPEVRRRILLGTYALRAGSYDNYFKQARRVRQLIQNDFRRVFCFPDVRFHSHPSDTGMVDFLIHPTAIRSAPPLSEVRTETSGLDTYVQDVLTVPASLAGLPACSIPVRYDTSTADEDDDGWPIGVTIVAQWGCDQLLLDVASIINDAVQK